MRRIIILSVSLLLLLLPACKQKKPKISEPSISETEAVREIGAQAATAMTDSLKKKLKIALLEGGPVRAVNVCSQEALALTNAVGNVEGHPVSVKRTTFQFRNPANMPDEYEKLALTHFENLIKSDVEILTFYIQKIHENGQDFFYYYQPLKTGRLCLACHGQPEEMDEALKQVLGERYPADKATGYKEGEFRGLVRVKVSGVPSI